jgi:hypothetical protein
MLLATLVLLFELDRVPVGTVTLEQTPSGVEYRSVHFLTRVGTTERKARSRLLPSEGPRVFPSVYLWHRPQSAGCVKAEDELARKLGELSVSELAGQELRGTLFGQPFWARYDDAQTLKELELLPARFVAVSGERAIAPPDLFEKGLPVAGAQGALQWAPGWESEAPSFTAAISAKDAKGLYARVRRRFAARPEVFCLEIARAYVEAAPKGSAQVVDGVYVPPGTSRALPHAWVRVQLPDGTFWEADPTLGVAVRAQTHLVLAIGDRTVAGARWLEAFAGGRQVIRQR